MTALENVELPTDALPVDAVLRRAAASHHRTSIGQQPRSASAGRADKRPGCVYIVVCVCAGRDGGIREEDERGGHKEYASDEKALAVLSLQQTPSTSSKPQFISQTCISAVLLNSSPLTDLASIVAEVDANEVFMLHKTNMLEEIGAENELMERSCAGMMDWIGMGGLPDVDEEEEERRKETEAKEEEERLREERKEQELNKVAEETNEQEKRAKEAQPQLRTNTHLTSHSTTVCVAARPPSFLSPSTRPFSTLPSTSSLVQYSSYLSPSRPISTNSLAPSALGPHTTRITETSWINTATVCSETMSDAWEGVGNKEKRKELDELWGTKRNLKAMEEGDAQSSVATGQSEVAVSVEQAKKAREELEK
ncbi:hypothetical protein BLNAU_25275 [Blattamonas nauphoetae]|uniref:Uncharacterized protein n=1 Tax=Blattamonas nauphoetae TaxID=2049346 RepID=A0ABQ9WK25_9EUKA|nr:hypothetical protein BLNAU_25275 [Blattamonas nauphoetae]